MARRTKYTPATVEKVCQAIKLGATYDLACKYAGIHIDTFCTWRNTKREFSEAVEKAEGDAVIGWLAKIEREANEGQWTAAAWKLERRYPQLYGRKAVEVSGPDGGSVNIVIRRVDGRTADAGDGPD